MQNETELSESGFYQPFNAFYSHHNDFLRYEADVLVAAQRRNVEFSISVKENRCAASEMFIFQKWSLHQMQNTPTAVFLGIRMPEKN
jgi:hypothetical protein